MIKTGYAEKNNGLSMGKIRILTEKRNEKRGGGERKERKNDLVSNMVLDRVESRLKW